MNRDPMLPALTWCLGVFCLVALAGVDLRAEDETVPVKRIEDLPTVQSDKAGDDRPAYFDTSAVATGGSAAGTEIIRERFPDGAVRIEREVIQDAEENYINHGRWRMWDKQHNPVGQGQFRGGKRSGTWIGWHFRDESDMFSEPPFADFTGPFVSKAMFTDGKLHGTWLIYDDKQRKICEWPYENGLRHGTWSWWYPTGQKMRELRYVHGNIEGEAYQWNAASQLVAKNTYEGGRRLESKVEYHGNSDRQRKSECIYLLAKRVPQSPDDWWNARLALEKPDGKDERHGFWVSWHPNGQEKMRGNIRNDVQVGEFSWWHANGQKSVEGGFENGKRHAKWTWWHPNGQKYAQGQFSYGSQVGRWLYWNPAGKVTQRVDFSAAKANVAERRPTQPAPIR